MERRQVKEEIPSSSSRNEDPRLIPRRSSRLSTSLSSEEMSLSEASEKMFKNYDFNSNLSKNGRNPAGRDSRSRKRTRSQTSVATTCEEEMLAILSPKAPSDSCITVEKNSSPDVSMVSGCFLQCVICLKTPSGPPLYGCDQSHLVCSSCREMGGALLSCPRCGSDNFNNRQHVAEELLMTELGRNNVVSCPYSVSGCNKITRSQLMEEHRQTCVFRPVKCPKGMFSLSCMYIGPLYTMQQHARDEHNLHHGVTILQPGLISSKMFDKSADRTCCDDKSNAKFQPLELCFSDQLFYCYFERVVDRKLWFFFIRMFGREDISRKFEGSIMIGHSSLGREEFSKAGLKYQGPIADYNMKREEIRDKGCILAVPDEFLKSCKVGSVLFRVWFQVKEMG